MQRIQKRRLASELESGLMPCSPLIGRALHFLMSDQQNALPHTSFFYHCKIWRRRGIRKRGLSSILGLSFLSRLIITDAVWHGAAGRTGKHSTANHCAQSDLIIAEPAAEKPRQSQRQKWTRTHKPTNKLASVTRQVCSQWRCIKLYVFSTWLFSHSPKQKKTDRWCHQLCLCFFFSTAAVCAWFILFAYQYVYTHLKV